MKIPKTVKILGHDVRVMYPFKFVSSESLGFVRHALDTIWVCGDDTTSEDGEGVTFIHEVLHRVCVILGESELSNNEDIISRLSEGLYQILKDNNLDFTMQDKDRDV